MPRFDSWGHGCSSPIRSEAGCPPDDRAWPKAALKTTVDHTLMRGSAAAGPRLVSGLPRSRGGRRRPVPWWITRVPLRAPPPAVRDPGQWWVGGVGLPAAGLGGRSAQAAAAGRTWRAIAQAKAAISRATAAVTRFAFLPAATRRR